MNNFKKFLGLCLSVVLIACMVYCPYSVLATEEDTDIDVSDENGEIVDNKPQIVPGMTSPDNTDVYSATVSKDGTVLFSTTTKAIGLNKKYEASVWVKHDNIDLTFGAFVPTNSGESYIEGVNDYAYSNSGQTVGAAHLEYTYKVDSNILSTGNDSSFSTSITTSDTNDGFIKLLITFTTDSLAVCAKDTALFLRADTAKETPLYFSSLTLTEITEVEEETTVVTEEGKDAGYLLKAGNLYSAVAYDGNKFLGYYKGDQLLTKENNLDITQYSGKIVAKFEDNNVLSSTGFELYNSGHSLMSFDENSDSQFVCTEANSSWVFASVIEDASIAYSGTKVVELNGAWREGMYCNLKGLEQDTYYKVSFKYKAKADGGSFRGIIAAPSSVATVTNARKNALGQNILNNSNVTNLTTGTWYKTTMEFFTDKNTDVKLFIAVGSGRLYLDEFTVYKADALDDKTHTLSVSAQNGKAYASKTEDIANNETVVVTAVGNNNSEFVGWYEDDSLVSSNVNYSYKAIKNRTLKAVFELTEQGIGAKAKYDLNKDGAVTEDDATLILNHILKISTLEVSADFNNDGKVSVSDIVILRNNFYTPKESPVKEDVLLGQDVLFNDATLINKGDNAPLAKLLKEGGYGITVIGSESGFINKVSSYLSTSDIAFNTIGSANATSSNISITEVLNNSKELVFVDLSLYDTANDNVKFETILRTLKDNGKTVIVLNLANEGATNKEAQIPVSVLYNIPVIDIQNAIDTTNVITVSEYQSNKDNIIAGAIINYLSMVKENLDSISLVPLKMPGLFFYGNNGYVLNDYKEQTTVLSENKDAVLLNGRTYWKDGKLGADWIGSGFTVTGNFSGEFKITLSVNNSYIDTEGSSGNIYVIVDNKQYNAQNIILDAVSGTFTLCNLTPGVHTIQVYKATEPRLGTMSIESITYNGILYSKATQKALKIEVYGDSITSGCALLTAEQEPNDYISQDGYKSYGNRTAMAFDADVSIVSRSGASVMSASDNLIQDFCYNEQYGNEGEWDYANNQADIVIVGLGTNDLTNIQNNPSGLKEEVKKMLLKLRAYHPNAHIIWVYGMMQTSSPEIFSGAVAELNDPMMHFVMLPRNADGGGGHPTSEGQRNATSTLVEYIRDNIL